ncbi:MAG: GNAT family N-acetyltransferase [Candidatus Buchananbacteria bacterium]
MRRRPESEIKPSPNELLRMTLDSADVIDLPEDNEAFKGMQAFEIRVKDKDKWQTEEEMKKLVDSFGDLAMKAYGSRENPPVYDRNNPESVAKALEDIADGDISIGDRVFVVSDNEKVVSFLVVEEFDTSDERKLGYVALNVTAPDQRNKGYAAELLREYIKNGDAEIIMGISSTPAAIQIGHNIAKEFGFQNYFCGYKDGVYGDRGTPEEQAEIDKLHKEIETEWRKAEVTIEDEMPAGYIVIDEKNGPIRPLKAEEMKFPQGSPLEKTFREGLLPVQEKFMPHTVYGIDLAIRSKIE